jgi:putative ABC transport system ATP-binding protein
MSQEIRVLRGLEAEIKTGEVVAIVGQSGTGKSTLLSLLAGLDSPDSGQILINETDLTRLNQREMTAFRAQNIGFVFQQFHLMSHLTALENVMLPLEILHQQNCQQQANEILQRMNLADRINHLPSQLSGGECQRVAIARAMVVKPQILLADEPSGNLDVETGELVMKEFFRQVRNQKVTTIVVTHNEAIAEVCDRSLVLREGLLK